MYIGTRNAVLASVVFFATVISCSPTFAQTANEHVRMTPLPRKQNPRMWAEYLTATRQGPDALQTWATKYNVRLLAPGLMEMTRTITRPLRGARVLPKSCSDYCLPNFNYDDTQHSPAGDLALHSECSLSECHRQCSFGQCTISCVYDCVTTAFLTWSY
jgi:hypothetical protein